MAERKYFRLEITRGDYLTVYLRVWEGHRGLGVLKDFTGHTARMHVRETPDSETILLAPTVVLGENTTTDMHGNTITYNVRIEATQAQTRAYSHDGVAHFDVEWEDAFGHVTTFMRGIVVLNKDVTRAA